jgi:predicted enzyme related to lactoylglutathione lyase
MSVVGASVGGMAKMEHFEIPVDDITRAQTFYSTVLGYQYEPWGDEMGMLRHPDGEGVNGDLHKRSTTPHPTVVFTVDRIEETVALAVANGGEQVGDIQPLDENSRWVYVKDSEGNLIGLYDEVSAA